MIKIHLQKLEKSIIFQILDQDIQDGAYILRRNFTINGTIGQSGKTIVQIKKVSVPEIKMTLRNQVWGVYRFGYKKSDKIPSNVEAISDIIIYLRGDMSVRHHSVINIPFFENRSRDKIYDLLMESFKKFKE